MVMAPSSPTAVSNPEGHPAALMVECGHEGPYGWVDNRGHVIGMRCNRPRAHSGLHGHSPKDGPPAQRWGDSDRRIYSTSLKGPWQIVRRVY